MKTFNLRNEKEVPKFKSYVDKLLSSGSRCKIEETNTRTSQQNRALHLFFTMIATELNEGGATFSYEGITGVNFETTYTTNIVKEFIWKPIQIQMFSIKSTTKLNTKQMNDIIDVIINAFGSNGVVLEFPSIESLIKN